MLKITYNKVLPTVSKNFHIIIAAFRSGLIWKGLNSTLSYAMLHVALQRNYQFLELGKKDSFRYQIKVKIAKSNKTLHIYLCKIL